MRRVDEAEGGSVLRDLFTEDGGGWLEDPALLDRMVGDKLTALADEARQRENWKWAEAASDYVAVNALGRVYPVEVVRSEADAAQIAALSEEYDVLVSEAGPEGLTPEADARLEEIDKALQAFGPDFDYPAEVKARAGVMVLLGHDGLARFERGLVKAEDAVSDRAPDPDAPESWSEPETQDGETAPPAPEAEADEGLAPLSERLVIDLTAHRTMGLRDAVQQPTQAAVGRPIGRIDQYSGLIDEFETTADHQSDPGRLGGLRRDVSQTTPASPPWRRPSSKHAISAFSSPAST